MIKFIKDALQNLKSNDLETSHEALGTQSLKIYINDEPGFTLTNFAPISNLGETVKKSLNWK